MGIFSSKKKGILNYPYSKSEKFDILIKDQNQRIKIIVGGEEFYLSLNTIKNSNFNSFFTKMINNKKEIFLDRCPDNFQAILQILRLSLYRGKTNFFHFKTMIKDRDTFFDDLKFYFKEEEYLEIIQTFDLLKIIDTRGINEEIESYELIKPNEDELLKYMFYVAKDIKELYHTYCQRGFFFIPGGGIILKLFKPTAIKKIQLRLFVNDSNFFNPNDCEEVGVYYKDTGHRWVRVGLFSLTSDEFNINTIYLNIISQEIKLSTEESKTPFSLSYIKLN